MDDYDILLREITEGIAECPKCGERIEVDGKCSCGGQSKCMEYGII